MGKIQLRGQTKSDEEGSISRKVIRVFRSIKARTTKAPDLEMGVKVALVYELFVEKHGVKKAGGLRY